MTNKKIIIEPNANIHHVAGEDLHKQGERTYQEYRRKWKEWPEEYYAGEFPLFIDIEATSACNLKCPFCATTFRHQKIKKGFMSFDILKKIINEGADNELYGVKFSMRGEPLLHSRIHEFVAYAKKKGLIDVYFNTNAKSLSEEISQKLIDAGLDRISVSVEGFSKEVYERHRVGAEFEKVLKNIENLKQLREKNGVNHPKIRIQMVMIPELRLQFDKYKEFWIKRADEVNFLDYKEMKEKKKGIKYPWACPQIWQRMAVWWDGTILPCNHDDDGLLSLGNMKEITIKEAWNSKKMMSLREKHKKDKAHEIPACDGCYLRDSEILKLKSKNG